MRMGTLRESRHSARQRAVADVHAEGGGRLSSSSSAPAPPLWWRTVLTGRCGRTADASGIVDSGRDLWGAEATAREGSL
jgi:hypothetical protein